MAEWVIEPFGKKHDRSGFSCGQPALDDFIRTRVSQYEKRRLGKTFVAVVPGSQEVIGYYTIAAGAVSFEHLPAEASRKLPKHPVPAVLLARLAVDQSFKGRGMGEDLLFDALKRSLGLGESLGIHVIEVDAIDDMAVAFYRKYGFMPLTDNPQHLYLPMATVEQVCG